MSRIQIRRGTAAQWTNANPTLYAGEFGYETDTNKVKLGTGTTAWNSLAYVSLEYDTFAGLTATLTNKTISGSNNTLTNIAQSSVTDLETDLGAKEDAANKGVANGYAALDGDGLVPLTQLPVTQADWTTLEGKPAYVAAGATKADARNAIDAEPVINTGTTGQWFRGDKTWHALTKSDVGLANVDNTSDSTKNSATATLTNKTISGSDNTLSNIPQSAVTDLATDLAGKESTANKNTAGGYAGLDGSGRVAAAQLPSYVDDVVEGADLASLPGTGETGKIYVALDTNKVFRWSGSAYVEVSPSPGSTDSVTEGSTNLYFTNARADARIANAVGVSVQGYDADLTAFAAKTAPTGAVVGTSDTQTLTNKTISGSSNTLSDIAVSSISATGTPGSTTYLRGDGSWSAVVGVSIDGGSAASSTADIIDGGSA